MAGTNDLIRSRIETFVDELTVLIHQAILENVESVLGQPVSVAERRSRQAGKTTVTPNSPPRANKKRGGKRTQAELSAMADQVMAFVGGNPASSIEEIGRAVGVPTQDLALPVKKLLAERRLKKKGQKRATRYSAGR